MKKALIIGLNEYSRQPLDWCVNDASEIANLVETNGDGAHNFDTERIFGRVTTDAMYTAIENLFKDNSDIALLYFSGHGIDERGGYLCPTDICNSNYGVGMSNLLNIANNSHCKNKIIILDCCFAAKLGTFDSFGDCSHLSNGLTIMAACEEWQTSSESSQLEHGVFTNLLIDGLKGGAADVRGIITPANLYSYIDQSLGAWQQRPVFKTNTSRFIPLRTVQPKVSETILRNITKYFTSPDSEYQLDPSYEYTNSPNVEHLIKEPYADDNNVLIFKELQKLTSVGIVEPVNEDHMYFAAMNNKSCKLTKLGQHYWNLVKDKRF